MEVVDHNPSSVNDFVERETKENRIKIITAKIETLLVFQDYVGDFMDDYVVIGINQHHN